MDNERLTIGNGQLTIKTIMGCPSLRSDDFLASLLGPCLANTLQNQDFEVLRAAGHKRPAQNQRFWQSA